MEADRRNRIFLKILHFLFKSTQTPADNMIKRSIINSSEPRGGSLVVNSPDYIRLIVNNSPRRVNSGEKVRSTTCAGESSVSTTETKSSQSGSASDVVRLFNKENLTGATSQTPTADEAKQALKQLEQDLPNRDQDVDVHDKLDRRRILGLLAPLVEEA
jgi:hypothetical protein